MLRNHALLGALGLWCILLLAVSAVAQTAPSDAVQASPDTAQKASDFASPPRPPAQLVVNDFKYDMGNALELRWETSPEDTIGGRVSGYQILRSTNGGEYEVIVTADPGATFYRDEGVFGDSSYVYSIVTSANDLISEAVMSESIQPQEDWVNWHRKWLFLIALTVSAAVIFFIETARSGKKLFIRKIAGLEAVDEAIGRATEMGRPILFIPGIQDMDNVQTIAGLTILGHVSRLVADYDTKILMPVSRSLVMTAARETIKTSYMAAGRPDAYSDDMVHYVTDEQFGYVAAVDGIMVRQKPATCFYLGAFFAESLIIAETGNSIGAIQIAGTAMPAQLPFFVAACDFTLIGEELFAASAYLSNEPKQLGSLKGQDVGKGIAMVVIIVGALAATINAAWDIEPVQDLLEFLVLVFTTQ